MATIDDSLTLSPLETRNIQKITGSFLYYSRVVDNTIYPASNEIGSTQAKPTQATKDSTHMLMGYPNTHPNTKLRFHKSDMQLHIE